MANLLDSVQEYLHPGFITEAAGQLGEGEEATSRALHAWCATILAGLLNWVGHEKAMGQIFHHLELYPPNLTEQPKALLRDSDSGDSDPKNISEKLLGQLFGTKTEALVKGIAAFSGASPGNVHYLLGVSGPVVLSILGQRLQTGALSHSGLSNLLLHNRDRVLSALPSGIGSILELRPMDEGQIELPEAATGYAWTLPLLLLLGLGGLILVYLRYSGN